MKYKERDILNDRAVRISLTIEENLYKNLQIFREKNKLKSLSRHMNKLIWDWFNDQTQDKKIKMEVDSSPQKT